MKIKVNRINTAFVMPAQVSNARVRLKSAKAPDDKSQCLVRKRYLGGLALAIGAGALSQVPVHEIELPSGGVSTMSLKTSGARQGSGNEVIERIHRPASKTAETAAPRQSAHVTTTSIQTPYKQAWDQVFDHLKHAWRVPDTLAIEILSSVERAQKQFDLSPALILAVMATESSFKHVGNPDGKFNPHKPFGLMQVYGKWHPEKFPEGRPRVTRPKENIMIGAQVLKEYIDREEGNLVRALHRYNGSLDDPTRKYSKKVLGYYKEFKSMMQPSTARLMANNP